MKQRYLQDPYTPRPEHHVAFGLWTVGRISGPWGEPRRCGLALGEQARVVEADFVKAL
jgi:hypothetical protein